MKHRAVVWALFTLLLSPFTATAENGDHRWWQRDKPAHNKQHDNVQLGPRPYFLVAAMEDSRLKRKLQRCAKGPFKRTDFSIGHRGAPLQFPEHTQESYEAAARMGAGIVECDVTFTEDKELVCRHSQCDLHTTTNILTTPLAAKCSQPFQPARFDSQGNLVQPASARCCTSDITLGEFKSLKGKMDAYDPQAQTPTAYQGGTANWRTDLYADTGTLLTHRESIALFKKLNVKMTPELKAPAVPMPFDGMTQQDYAQRLIDEYREAGVRPHNVWPQSFNIDDVYYWLDHNPDFGRQAVYLDGRDSHANFDHRDPDSLEPSMDALQRAGVNIIAPPLWMLLEVEDGKPAASAYAKAAKQAGLDIIAWTFERTGPLANGGGWYYQTLNGTNANPNTHEPAIIDSEADRMVVLHTLAQEVGIIGLFSDWPATVTYYANCMKRR